MKKEWYKENWAIVGVLVFISLIFLSFYLPGSPEEFVEEVNPEYSPSYSPSYIDLSFYDSNTNCSLTGTLILGNFSDIVIGGQYRLYEKDYLNIETNEVILQGETDSCFGANSELPFYVVWNSDYLLDSSPQNFDADLTDLRSPLWPQAMQGFIRPEEVGERYSRIKINENDSHLKNLDRIFAYGYIDYVSDDRFGKKDYWMTPKDFMEAKGGDCEDWAIYMTSLTRRYNSSLDCYFAIWYTHANVICAVDRTYLIYDQEKVKKRAILDEDLSYQDNQIIVRKWINAYFDEYGISPSDRKLFYLINEEDIIVFEEEGNEDFVNWAVQKAGITKEE